MSSKTIKLTSKTVTMREPKVRDERAVKGIEDDGEREMALISNLTGLTTDEIDDLTIKDYMRLQEALLGFYA